MSTIDELYGERKGSYYRASDVPKPTELTIKDVSIEEFKEGKRLVLSFSGTDKKLALNSTNARQLEQLYGSDYKKWVKKTITLEAVPTTYNGEQVKGLRIH